MSKKLLLQIGFGLSLTFAQFWWHLAAWFLASKMEKPDKKKALRWMVHRSDILLKSVDSGIRR